MTPLLFTKPCRTPRFLNGDESLVKILANSGINLSDIRSISIEVTHRGAEEIRSPGTDGGTGLSGETKAEKLFNDSEAADGITALPDEATRTLYVEALQARTEQLLQERQEQCRREEAERRREAERQKHYVALFKTRLQEVLGIEAEPSALEFRVGHAVVFYRDAGLLVHPFEYNPYCSVEEQEAVILTKADFGRWLLEQQQRERFGQQIEDGSPLNGSPLKSQASEASTADDI